MVGWLVDVMSAFKTMVRTRDSVKRDYYNNKMLQDTCDKKNYWKYIKELINKDDSNQYPDHFIIDKIPITDKKKISNSFNDFFCY